MEKNALDKDNCGKRNPVLDHVMSAMGMTATTDKPGPIFGCSIGGRDYAVVRSMTTGYVVTVRDFYREQPYEYHTFEFDAEVHTFLKERLADAYKAAFGTTD
jgi:hypothetical protein